MTSTLSLKQNSNKYLTLYTHNSFTQFRNNTVEEKEPIILIQCFFISSCF